MEKKNKIFIGIIVALALIVVGLSVFVVYDKVLNKNEKTDSTDNPSSSTNSRTERLLTEEQALEEGKKLYDKATEIYEIWQLYPYCGLNPNEYEGDTEALGDSELGNGEYYKSNFSSLEDLKKYLTQWLSEDIVNSKVVKEFKVDGEVEYNYVEDLSLLKGNEKYAYVDYVLKDNALYCRLETGKGWMSSYYGYDIKVDSIEEDKIVYTVTSKYIKESSECSENCKDEDLNYKDTKFVIERNSSGKFVVTNYTFYE